MMIITATATATDPDFRAGFPVRLPGIVPPGGARRACPLFDRRARPDSPLKRKVSPLQPALSFGRDTLRQIPDTKDPR